MKKLPTLYAVVCGNGNIYWDGDRFAVFTNDMEADECLEGVRSGGGLCSGDHAHFIIFYEPKIGAPGKKKYAKAARSR
jgi:hypothetical protein